MQADEFQNLSSDILRQCSDLALNMNMLPTAFQLLTKLLSYDSRDVRSLLLLSNAYLKNKNFINVVHLLIDAINSKTDFIINDYRIWKQLAFAYYRLNKYEDAHHAISQALSSISSPRLSFERQKLHNPEKITSFSTNSNNNNNHRIHHLIHHNQNNSQTLSKIPNNLTNIKSYTILLSKEEVDILKYKIAILNCRITLLAPQKTHSISLLLSDFQMALSQIGFNKNVSLYVEILITRAQLYRKYNLMEKCKQDLIQCLIILNENKDKFTDDDLSHKVTYCYFFLISVEFLNNSGIDLVMKLINEVQTNFQLSNSCLEKFLILETYISIINNSDNLRHYIDKLKFEITLAPISIKPLLFYTLGRLVLKESSNIDIESAYNYYQEALGLTPEDPIIWISFASLYFELGQMDDALSTYSQAASLSSSSEVLQSCTPFEIKLYNKITALAWFGISQVYCATNQLTNAVSSINKAIGLFRLENDTLHTEELERIRVKLQTSQTRYRRYKESRTVQQIINSEEGLSDEGSIKSKSKKDKLGIKYVIPDIPFEFLIEKETFNDKDVFLTETELDPVNLTDFQTEEMIPDSDKAINSIIPNNVYPNYYSRPTPMDSSKQMVTNPLVPISILNHHNSPHSRDSSSYTSDPNTPFMGTYIKNEVVPNNPNRIFKPMIHQRSYSHPRSNNYNNGSESNSHSKFVIIPTQKHHKKIEQNNHLSDNVNTMIPISAGVPDVAETEDNIFEHDVTKDS